MIRLVNKDVIVIDGHVHNRELTLIEHLEISKALARYYGRNVGKKYFDKHLQVVI